MAPVPVRPTPYQGPTLRPEEVVLTRDQAKTVASDVRELLGAAMSPGELSCEPALVRLTELVKRLEQ